MLMSDAKQVDVLSDTARISCLFPRDTDEVDTFTPYLLL